jgi:hypothetical protein
MPQPLLIFLRALQALVSVRVMKINGCINHGRPQKATETATARTNHGSHGGHGNGTFEKQTNKVTVVGERDAQAPRVQENTRK